MIDPGAQPRVAPLPFERGNAVVLLRTSDLLAKRAPELCRVGPRRHRGQELVAVSEALAGLLVETGHTAGQHVDVIHVDGARREGSTEIGHQFDSFGASEWLNGLSQRDARRIGHDLFGEDAGSFAGKIVEALRDRNRAGLDPRP